MKKLKLSDWIILIALSVIVSLVGIVELHGAKASLIPIKKRIELPLQLQDQLEGIVYPPMQFLTNQMHDEGCDRPLGVAVITHDPVSIDLIMTCQSDDKEGTEARNVPR